MKKNKIHLPLVLSVENRTVKPLYDFEILNTGKELSKDNKEIVFGFESFDFTYKELISFLKDNDLNIKTIHVQSTHSSQLYSLIQYDNKIEKITLIPDLDSDSFSPMNFKHSGLVLNGKTTIKVKKFENCTTLRLYLN